MLVSTPPTARELRGRIAEAQIDRYVIAGLVRVHPGRLSSMLNERIPMPGDVAARIESVLRERV